MRYALELTLQSDNTGRVHYQRHGFSSPPCQSLAWCHPSLGSRRARRMASEKRQPLEIE